MKNSVHYKFYLLLLCRKKRKEYDNEKRKWKRIKIQHEVKKKEKICWTKLNQRKRRFRKEDFKTEERGEIKQF